MIVHLIELVTGCLQLEAVDCTVGNGTGILGDPLGTIPHKCDSK